MLFVDLVQALPAAGGVSRVSCYVQLSIPILLRDHLRDGDYDNGDYDNVVVVSIAVHAPFLRSAKSNLNSPRNKSEFVR